MQEWIQNMVGDTMNPVVAYIIIFLAIILAIYILVRIARRLLGGTFVAGGKSRHLRLAVMDATPVDSHRRLVLVRRDDVEHLILIGGPTDVVVEQNIKLAGQVAARQEPIPQEPSRQEPTHTPAPVPAPTARVETPTPPIPLRPMQPVAQPQQAPRPYTPAPAAPRPIQPAAPAPVRQLSPVIPTTEPRPVAAPEKSAERPASAPALSTAPPAAMGAAAGTISTLTPAAAKPASHEDSLLVDLSNDIEKASNNESDEISLEDEMEGLLASLDTKGERIG